MSDYEISNFCTSSVEEVSLMCRKQTWTIAEFASPKELHKYALDPEVFLEGGKVMAMVKHIERCKAEGKRMLLFSQASHQLFLLFFYNQLLTNIAVCHDP